MFKPILKAIASSETEVSIQSLPEGNLGDEIFEAFIQEGVKDDLSLLKSKPQNFKIEVDFKEIFQTKSEKKIILPWVTKLRIVILIEASDFTKESIKFLIKLISEIFPNIETIDFAFYFVNPTWKPIYSIMKEINEEWFQDFPKNIKGEIDLHASCGSNSSYKVFSELIARDNEYVDCTQAVKYFDIRKDLTFSFRLNYD
uniref:Uncharacterized protein n=1 Tax=Panagrolaimus davidi TaxID=227884 RepID=A0A914P4M0_9BILA